jgi:hypothetical protein
MEKHLQATRMAIFTLIDRMATKQRKCTSRFSDGDIDNSSQTSGEIVYRGIHSFNGERKGPS